MAKRKKNASDWSKAVEHLRRADPVLAKIIKQVGPCNLEPHRDYFGALCHAIFSQQISSKVAATLYSRFRLMFPRGTVTAKHVCGLTEEQLQSAGLSRQKRSYVRDLGEKFARGAIPTRRFAKMSDEEVIQALIPIRGVGRWTAEMFLMFVMNRPDVWPVDDFGLQMAVKRIWGMRTMPSKKRLMKMGEAWRPWRTVASWYLWRSGDL